MAQRQQHVHNQGHKQGDGERGSAHNKGLCSPDSWPQKGRAFTRRWRAQCVGVDGEPELGVRSSGQGTTRLQGKGARAATTAAAPAKRPARLDGRLSSDGRSARRRDAGQRSSHNQRAHKARSSLGSTAGSTTRRREFLTSRSVHDGEEGAVESSGTAWSRGSRARGPWLPRRHHPGAAAPLLGVPASSVKMDAGGPTW
jgi:hypothetical protein